MTAQEMMRVLAGGHDGKVRLFNEFMSRVTSGEQLTDDEIPILEALKKELIKPAGQVVQMEATIVGRAQAQVSGG